MKKTIQNLIFLSLFGILVVGCGEEKNGVAKCNDYMDILWFNGDKIKQGKMTSEEWEELKNKLDKQHDNAINACANYKGDGKTEDLDKWIGDKVGCVNKYKVGIGVESAC
jgi:hypothetical protein